MKKHFTDFRAIKERVSMEKIEMDHRVAKLASYHFKESKDAPTLNDKEALIQLTIQASLEDWWQQDKVAKHRS